MFGNYVDYGMCSVKAAQSELNESNPHERTPHERMNEGSHATFLNLYIDGIATIFWWFVHCSREI